MKKLLTNKIAQFEPNPSKGLTFLQQNNKGLTMVVYKRFIRGNFQL
jgi:hypothetical protein